MDDVCRYVSLFHLSGFTIRAAEFLVRIFSWSPSRAEYPVAAADSARRLRIPSGFRPKAQGCAARATLGYRPTNVFNRNAVVAFRSLPAIGQNRVAVVSISEQLPKVLVPGNLGLEVTIPLGLLAFLLNPP